MSVMILKSGYVVDGLGLVPRIKGIYRDSSERRERWVVSPTNDNNLEERAYFHDNTYGSAHAAYKAAVQHLYHHGELYKQGMRRYLKEREDKKWMTGTVGVCVRVQHRGQLDYYTIVATPIAEQAGCIVYAGNEHTHKKYFDAALQICTNHRENAVHRYVKRRRVKLKDAMPWHIPGIM
ncbi:AP2 domain protein [compost metagenome]